MREPLSLRLRHLSVSSRRKAHTAEPLHKCQFCNKTFTNMTKYLYHRRSHLNLDPAATPAPVSTTLVRPLRLGLNVI